MKISLWQTFAVTMWLAICLAAACALTLPTSWRVGIPLLTTGLVLTFGRSIFPRPPDREHVANEKLLQKLSDLILLGIPASMLIFVGFTFLTGNVIFALFGSVGISFAYMNYLFSR